MYCRNCGSELHESARFCQKCGSPVNIQIPDSQRPSNPSNMQQPIPNSSGGKNKKPRKKWWIWLIVSGTVLALAAAALIFLPFVLDSNDTEDTKPLENLGKGNPAVETTVAPTERIIESEAPVTSGKDVDFSVWHVALIVDSGSVEDDYFKASYDAARKWCEKYGVDCSYYIPSGSLPYALTEAVDQAVSDGYNILFLPGYTFAESIVKSAPLYPDVYFISMDIGDFDFQIAAGTEDTFSYVLPSNVFNAEYMVEYSGFMAGYAAVKLGYTNLGFLGGMAVPQVVHYGYGFLQGADAAATELGIHVEVNYAYANQFFGDEDITSYMRKWYQSGTEIVFPCGGGVYTSVAEAAKAYNGKTIGMDVDQSATFDTYQNGMAITSAKKGMGETVTFMLDELILNDNWAAHGGKDELLGMVSGDDPSLNFVGISDKTQWNSEFSEADYTQLVADIFWGKYDISSDTDIYNLPALHSVSVNYEGNLK